MQISASVNVCKRLFCRAAVWGILFAPLFASAQSYDQGPVFSAIEENDLVVKTDRHYTQGIKLPTSNAMVTCPASWIDLASAFPLWALNWAPINLAT